MNTTVEKFTANANETLHVQQEWATQANAHAAKLMELNLDTTKSMMSETFEYTKAMMEAKDSQSLAALQSSLVKPMSEIATTYAHELQRIMVSASEQFTKAAQASMFDVQRGITSMIESAAKDVPNGGGLVVDLFNQSVAAGQDAVDPATRSTQQAINTVKKSTK